MSYIEFKEIAAQRKPSGKFDTEAVVRYEKKLNKTECEFVSGTSIQFEDPTFDEFDEIMDPETSWDELYHYGKYIVGLLIILILMRMLLFK